MEFDYFPYPTLITAKTNAGPHKTLSQILTKQFLAYHGYVVDLSTGKGMDLDTFEFQYGAWDLTEIPWEKRAIKI